MKINAENNEKVIKGIINNNIKIKGHCKKCGKWSKLTSYQAFKGICPLCNPEVKNNVNTLVDCPLVKHQLFSYCKKCFFHPQSDLYPNCVVKRNIIGKEMR